MRFFLVDGPSYGLAFTTTCHLYSWSFGCRAETLNGVLPGRSTARTARAGGGW